MKAKSKILAMVAGAVTLACGMAHGTPWNEDDVAITDGDVVLTPTTYESVSLSFGGEAAKDGDVVAVFRDGDVFCGYGEVFRSNLEIILYAAKDERLSLKVWRSGTPDAAVLDVTRVAVGGSEVAQLLAPNPGDVVAGLALAFETPPEIHTLTFDAAGGSAVAPVTQAVGTAVTAPAAPTRTGYTFAGWSPAVPATMPAEDMALTAQWTVNRYTLTFDANGGTGGKTVTQDYGTAVTAPAAPTRTGYTFAGWSPAVPATVPAGNVTYTAQWKAVQYRVTLDLGGGTGDASVAIAYGTRVGDIPTPSRGGYAFDGWWTAADGGVRVSDNTAVTGDMSLYAHWTMARPQLWDEVTGAASVAAASTYDGYLCDASGNVKGTIQVKVGKPGKDGTAAIKATVIGLDGKKKNLKAAEKGKASIAANGPTEVVLVGGDPCTVTLGAQGMSGKYGSYDIDGALNVFASKDAADKTTATAVLGKWQGVVNVAWCSDATERVPPYNTLSVTIAAKGKAKVSGTLADGAKVSASSQMIVGEDWCCVPVLYVKKGVSLAFGLWLPRTQGGGALSTVVGLGGDVKVGKPGTLKGGAAFRIDADALAANWGQRALPYLPDGLPVTVSGGKWTLPKAGKVAYKKGTAEPDEEKLGENPSALKLTYTAKSGTFKGSFKAYVDVGGKPKATTVNVTGVLVDGVGYGAATIKKVGGVPVTIE